MPAAPQVSLDEVCQTRPFVAAKGDAQVSLPNKREFGGLTYIYYMPPWTDTPTKHVGSPGLYGVSVIGAGLGWTYGMASTCPG